MKIVKVLNNLNSLEKNSFTKILENIFEDLSKSNDNIELNSSIQQIIQRDNTQNLKSAESESLNELFNLVQEQYNSKLKELLNYINSQFDIIIDIIIRDGNAIMSSNWLHQLYEKELLKLKQNIEEYQKTSQDSNDPRSRDYKIYYDCVKVAFFNDVASNQNPKITGDEQEILNQLALSLGLSQEERKIINYSVIGIQEIKIDDLIKELKDSGVLFHSKKKDLIYIPDEIVIMLRKLRGKKVADKHFKRILLSLKESHLNQVMRYHSIKLKVDDVTTTRKIKAIIEEGIDIFNLLTNDIHKENVNKNDRKTFINNICEKPLGIIDRIKGASLEQKVESMIEYYQNLETDTKIGISLDGYDKMLSEINEYLENNKGKSLKVELKEEFELQENDILSSEFLLDYNIKPQDVLDILDESILKDFASYMNLKQRGIVSNIILDNYRDTDNLYLENYIEIASRDYSKLKENGINLKDAELGLKFEELTKKIFNELGFNVDEDLRKELNTKKDKIDLVINLGDNTLIIVECKTQKDKEFSKFSSVSRQIKSYLELAQSKNYNVIKSLLVAPSFTDDFEKECELEYQLNLSLIPASTLSAIHNGFKDIKLKEFPYNLFMRDVVINEERVLKALKR